MNGVNKWSEEIIAWVMNESESDYISNVNVYIWINFKKNEGILHCEHPLLCISRM